MRAVTKEEWTAALRSGEYKQSHMYLYNNDGFCCLGVLCNLAGMPKEDLDRRATSSISPQETPDETSAKLQAKFSPEFLHSDLVKKLGTFTPVENTNDMLIQNFLARQNDGGSTFSDIADWIDANM